MFRCGRAAIGGLVLFAPAAFAGGSVGLDYLSSEIDILGIGDSVTRVDTTGPGVSLSFSISDNWNLSLSHSDIDSGGAQLATSTNRINISVQSESSSNGVGLSYYGDSFWAGLRYRQSEDDQAVRGFSPINSALTLDVDQTQDSQSFTIELGKDWLMGDWSPAVSLSLSQQSLDIARVERIDTENVTRFQALQEDLSGTDLGISASLVYYLQLSDTVLLAPNIGIFHLTNLSGDVSGTASAGQTNQRRTQQFSQDYRDNLNAPEDTSVDIGLNLITGDWLWSAGMLTSLSAEESSDSWFVALSYSF
mgnify:CR=1 FL=1|jgi:hypothetical protein